MVLFCQGFKFMSRYQFKQLGKHCVIMRHGLISFLFFNDLSEFHCNKTNRFSGLFIQLLTGQQWHKYMLREPLNNSLISLAHRAFVDQGGFVQQCLDLANKANAELRMLCKPRRARPESFTCGVRNFAKAISISGSSCLAAKAFRSRRDIKELIRGSLVVIS